MPRSHGTGRIRFDPLKIREVRCFVHMKACKPQEHFIRQVVQTIQYQNWGRTSSWYRQKFKQRRVNTLTD